MRRLVGVLVPPVLAIAALIGLRLSAEAANLLSSAIYALLLPLVFIALTQFFRGLTADRPMSG